MIVQCDQFKQETVLLKKWKDISVLALEKKNTKLFQIENRTKHYCEQFKNEIVIKKWK